MSELILPLFPLYGVLFPGGVLPLRIFEPRYLDMISQCFKKGTGFGVCLIHEGEEVGTAALTYDVGTLVKIVDWHRTEEGLLGIVVMGQQRFQILSREVLPDQLIKARVHLIPNEPSQDIPTSYSTLSELLKAFVHHLGKSYEPATPDYHNASWLSQRLAELLPMPFEQRQHLLELSDAYQRLKIIDEILKSLNIRY